MALSAVVQNVVSDEITLASDLLKLRDRAELLKARFDQNDVYNQCANSANVQAIFPHLDQSKIGNCIAALSTVLAALGDDVTGEAVNLILMHE